MILCNRCRGRAKGHGESCWYCTEALCYNCWDAHGHCGHPEAIAANEAARSRQPGDPLLPIPQAERDPILAALERVINAARRVVT